MAIKMSFQVPKFTELNMFKFLLLGIIPATIAYSDGQMIIALVWIIIVIIFFCWSWK